MPFAAGSAAIFLHLRFEDVPDTLLQLVANPLFVLTEFGPVVVVELFDDLKCPPSVQDVSADKVPFQSVGYGAVSGCRSLPHASPSARSA